MVKHKCSKQAPLQRKRCNHGLHKKRGWRARSHANMFITASCNWHLYPLSLALEGTASHADRSAWHWLTDHTLHQWSQQTVTDSAQTAAVATAAAAAAAITGNFRYITDNQSSAVRSTVTVSGAPRSTHPLARLSNAPQLTSRCPCQVTVTTIKHSGQSPASTPSRDVMAPGFQQKIVMFFFSFGQHPQYNSRLTDFRQSKEIFFSCYVNSNMFCIDTRELKALLPHQKCAKTHTRQSGIFKTPKKVSALRRDR